MLKYNIDYKHQVNVVAQHSEIKINISERDVYYA